MRITSGGQSAVFSPKMYILLMRYFTVLLSSYITFHRKTLQSHHQHPKMQQNLLGHSSGPYFWQPPARGFPHVGEIAGHFKRISEE